MSDTYDYKPDPHAQRDEPPYLGGRAKRKPNKLEHYVCINERCEAEYDSIYAKPCPDCGAWGNKI